MCGIIGYIGKHNDLHTGIEALKRLEYRGYDSAGAAYYNTKTKKIIAKKATGAVARLEEKINLNQSIGGPFILHTRWATHGAPTVKNTHPHYDCTKNFYVVHNGIIENYEEIRKWLLKNGHKFVSQTDTEVLPHLVEHYFDGDLQESLRKSLEHVRGTYGILVASNYTPGEIVASRLSSPLLIGVGNGENFVSSDPAGILAHTKNVVYVEDNEIVRIKPDSLEISTRARNKKTPQIEEIEWDIEEAQKGGYPHFMLKEIMEQPDTISSTLRGRIVKKEGNVKLGGLDDVAERLRKVKKVHIVACGTAYYASLLGKYMLEEYAGIPTEVDLGSEFRYRKTLLNPEETAVLCVSQSGETADTLASMREAKNKGALTLGIVNVVGSTLARETDAGVYNHAGPEIGVASTKAFVSQLAVLSMFAVYMGRQRDMSFTMGSRITRELEKLPSYIGDILKHKKRIQGIAKKYKNSKHMVYLGRKYHYPTALEGALKLKEISYIHAEGYAGGEMKHGPIAMIDKNFPTFALLPEDSVYEKMVSNIEEIKARSGPVIALTTVNNKKIASLSDDVIYIPKTLEMLTPIISVVPLQLFSYYVGTEKGYNVDKPRNLAKSVTVE